MAGISKKKIKTQKGEIIKYTITYYDIFGKQHTSGIYNTIKDAKKDLNNFEKKISDKKTIDIGFIIKNYINECVKKKRATRTINFYKSNMENYLKEYLPIKYFKMTKKEWQDLIYKLRDVHTPYIANGCYRTIRAALNWAKDEGYIETNTFIKVQPVELPEVEHNHFDSDEILNLLEICKINFPEYYPLLFTFVGTGMREGEIFGLLKENINFERNIITVCTQYTGGEFKRQTKSKKIRTVYIFPTLAKVLKNYIKNDKTDSPLVFHNSKGNFLHPSNLRQRFWLKLLKITGYPPNYARIHDLRGSNTDVSAELDLPISFSQDQLGHASPTTTLKFYNKTNNSIRQQSVNKLEKVFGKCEQNMSKVGNFEKTNIIIFPRKSHHA